MRGVRATLMNRDSDYWSIARQALNCLVFLLPLLLAYEAGVLWLGGPTGESLRNGADYWMRCGLQQLGWHQVYVLPLLVVGGLVAWQIGGKYPWRTAPDTLFGMLAESLLYAFCLMIIGQVQDLVFRHWDRAVEVSMTFEDPSSEVLSRIISYLGAGIYEEVLFRLCLLPVCYGVFRLLLIPHRGAVSIAIVATSLFFSAAHYVGPGADQWAIFSFVFRAIAGIFFAVLFVLRGFGITAGCHAAYDVLVGVLLAPHLA
jgi:hypothetical protein